MENLPGRYLEELKEQRNWLRMAYHGNMDEKAGKEIFLEEQKRFDEIISRDLSTSIVRLHCWKAPEGVSLSRDTKGVFLCPYYERLPYDLTKEEWEELKATGNIAKENREYWITDIIYDSLESVEQMEPYMGKDRLVIFGHEWMYKEKRNLIVEMLEKLGNVHYII